MIPWPNSLWLVRHGESVGNVANEQARRNGAARLDLSINDVDVPLSDLGCRQADALGRWLADLDASQHPTVAVVSPYRRAMQTLERVMSASGLTDLPITVDERIRDREQGWLDRYTGLGMREHFPEEAERRTYLGKFWYRPPGGESWADVVLRLRAFFLELRLERAGERVLIVSHDVPVLLTRYVLEQLTPQQVVDLSGQLGNCSVTRYAEADGGLVLEAFNDVEPIAEATNAAVTAHE